MVRVTIASSSPMSAGAGKEIADQGGNAVDAAVASALVSLCTDYSIVVPGGSGFVSVWAPGEEPVTLDAYAEVPGRGLPPEAAAIRGERITMDYGGGATTHVGYGSVATPGAFLGLAEAAARWGRLPWRDLVQPAIRWADEGFPLSATADEYLDYSGELIFGWHPETRAFLRHADGRRKIKDELVRIPGLGDSLRAIAEEGVECFYRGSLARVVSDDVCAHGGRLTLRDLEEYEVIPREPIRIPLGDWEVAVNPGPAIGGVTLAAMVLLSNTEPFRSWGPEEVRRQVEIQQAVLDYRKEHLEGGGVFAERAAELLEAARAGDRRALNSSPSTVHISSADSDGLACSLTVSAGYCSGATATGTGIGLNNALGELELQPGALPEPGTRLSSNMAPAIARRTDGTVIAVGSSGASRITTAIAQTLWNHVQLGLPLEQAVAHPRLHVESFCGRPTVAFEPGIDVAETTGWESRPFPALHMYFGSVQAAQHDPSGELTAAADPRRFGVVAYGGA